MKKILFALLAIVAVWSVNVFASEKQKTKPVAKETVAKEEPMPALEDWQFSPIAVEKFPTQNFEKILMYVGESLGYPKAVSSANANGSTDISIQYMDVTWLSEEFREWQTYSPIKKFYIAGIYSKFNTRNAKETLTPEEFKSKTLGNYQCLNTVSNLLKDLNDKNIRVHGDLKTNLINCGLGRY